MSGERVKQGYLEKFAKGLIGESWQKVFIELYKDGTFVWYKKKDDRNTKGSVSLRVVCDYLTVGSYCRAIPYSPQLPSNNSIECMIAFPQEPNKKSKIHFFLASSEQDFNEWMSAIISTLPPKPSDQSHSAPPPSAPTASYNPYSPAVAVSATAQQANAPPPPLNIGFENLSISGQPPPYAPPPGQMPYPSQPGFPQPQHTYPPHPGAGYPPPPPQQPYAYAPQPQYPPQPQYGAQPSYPRQPYPQQQYAPQGYPQQPYQQPYQPAYPQQPPGHTTVVYQQRPQPQTVVVRDRRSHGMGSMTAGLMGGALAGYAAGRMMGGPFGWGGGWGWGRGSWGSWSWGSGGSWGSFGGGSWGSFGGFD